MEMACIKYFHIKIVSLIVITILMIVSCTLKEKQGTTLTEFEISESCLSLVTDSVVKDYINDKLYNSIISLSFEEDNDTLLFTYAGFSSMKELCREYIFYRHYRIVGYIERKPYNIIVFSNIYPFNRMLERTKQMIRPSDRVHLINGLYCEPFTKSNWIESFREPIIRRHYKFYNGKIQGMDIRMD
ncbi:MAG: hypothetical protein II900_01435 [Prevotella sp.]|nr:hypothetical protein [Prevotella sp.]